MNPAHFVRVKVCGITLPSDVEALEAMGVDYLGFNFFPGSKRFIPPPQASSLIRRLKRAIPVGVFVDATLQQIHETVAETGIQWIQLHGHEGWDILDNLQLPVIKAIPHTQLESYGGLKLEWSSKREQKKENAKTNPRYFLVDTQAGSAFGGTGQSFDWDELHQHKLPRPFFLAGGLGPENIAEAVKRTSPYAVDLNSRVEISPGVKNMGLVKDCLAKIRGTE